MLRATQQHLSWGEEDALIAAKVMGAEPASKGWAPLNPAIVKGFAARGAVISRSAAAFLDIAKRLRHDLKLLKTAADARGPKGLWPHQRVALSFLHAGHRPAYLIADDVGVGKTAPAILWAQACIQQRRKHPGRILTVCRNSAKDQWAREIHRWTGLEADIVRGTIPEQISRARRHGWVIGHWESLVHARDGYLAHDWDVIIADEAHQIANRKTLRADTLFALKANAKLALTAHPYANDPTELWSILHWLDPLTYGSYWRFFGMHVAAVPKSFGGYDIKGPRQPKLLRWELAPMMLRRTRKEVRPNLPQVTRPLRLVELTARGQKEYDRLKKAFFAELQVSKHKSKHIPIVNMLVRTTRMRQYLVDPGLLGARETSVKYPVVAEIMDEVRRPVVIFTSFKEAAKRLQDYLIHKHSYRVRCLHGDIQEVKRTHAARLFLKRKLGALIVVTQAGSESLNLGKYGVVIFLDLPWNAKTLEQAEGRVDRPEEGTGKQVPCTAYRILVQGSYEQRLEKKIEHKHEMFGQTFTVGQLEELFA